MGLTFDEYIKKKKKKFYFLNKIIFFKNSLFSSLKRKIKIKEKKNLIVPLSKSTIIIEKHDFKVALSLAMKYFNIKDEEEIIWKKIFYYRPVKNSLNDAYKFISFKTKEDYKYFFSQDNDFTINISPYINVFSTRKGKFIKLNIPKKKKSFLPLDLLNNILKKIDIEINDQLKNKIINQSKLPVKIAKWIPNSKIDGKIKIQFNRLKTKAYLNMTPPEIGGKIIELEDVLDEVTRLKIKTLPNHEKIKEVINSKNYNNPNLILDSNDYKKGLDGYFEEVFKKIKNKSYEKSINYQENKKNILSEIFIVEKNQLLVISHRSTKRNSVTDLFGNKVITENEKEVKFVLGRNTYIKKNKLFSQIDGCVYRVAKNKWVVENVLVLDEITNKFNEINHNGTIIVKKSIINSPPIYASKDIIVGEFINNSSVTAGNNIIVKSGIIGKKDNVIECQEGNLKARYLQGITTLVKGKILIEEIINSCHVICGDEVEFLENKGAIWGGKIQVKNKITVYNLGSLGSLKTVVEIGLPFNYLISKRKIEMQIKTLKKNIKELNLKKSNIISLDEKLEEVVGEIKKKTYDLIKLNEELIILENSIKKINLKNERIIIINNFYTNVHLKFLHLEFKSVYSRRRLNIYFNHEKNKLMFEKI